MYRALPLPDLSSSDDMLFLSVNASCAVMQKPSGMVAVSGDTSRSDGWSEQTYSGIYSAQTRTRGVPSYSPSQGFSHVDVKVSWELPFVSDSRPTHMPG
jgi:outer membrane scaffolding protein for murein synthesis (MipA/OmpV family)